MRHRGNEVDENGGLFRGREVPIGAPKATATPAAEEAAYISLIEKADLDKLNRRLRVCPVHTAT
jgi:hypothetical protein